MRKQDYALLAASIKCQRDDALKQIDNTTDAQILYRAIGIRDALETLAYSFAKSTSVKRDDFLRACAL